MPTKAQGRRHSRQSGKYKDRFLITERNKKRRAAARLKKANSAATAMRRLRRAQRKEDRRLAKIEAARLRKEAKNTATRVETPVTPADALPQS